MLYIPLCVCACVMFGDRLGKNRSFGSTDLLASCHGCIAGKDAGTLFPRSLSLALSLSLSLQHSRDKAQSAFSFRSRRSDDYIRVQLS